MKHPVFIPAVPCVLLGALMLALPACNTTKPKSAQGAQAWKVEPVMRSSGSPDSAAYAESFYRLGRNLDAQGRLSAAEGYYRKALAADSAHAEACNALGILLAQTGRLEESLLMLERAVQLVPASAGFRNNLGYARHLAGQSDLARGEFLEALRLEPANPRAAHNLKLAGGVAPPVVSVAPAAVLRNEPSLVLTETAPQRIELSFSTALAAAKPVGGSAEREPAPASTVVVASVVKLPEGESVRPLQAEALPLVGDAARTESMEWRLALSRALFSVQGAPEPARLSTSRSYRLEISNAMGMRGAARRVNALLMREGAPSAWLNDQRPFNQQQTRVLYARGYGEEADQLARRIGAEAVSAHEVWGQRAVHLRIVLGKDVKPLIASLPEDDPPPVLAGWAPPELSSVRSPSWLARLAD